MINPKINFLNIPIDAITMQETLNRAEDTIKNNNQIHHTVVNAGKIVMMQTDKVLAKSVIQADIINADGQAVVWASRFLGNSIPERVAGIDLMTNLVKLSHKMEFKCYFLGAKEGIVKKVINKFSEIYSPNIIAGFHHGYFDKSNEKKIAHLISESGANILFVAMTSPKKEIFLYDNREQLKNVNFIMGVGGSFDVIAGKVKRSPLWMQNMGLEWLFRLFQEPRRMFKRYLFGNIKFIILVLREKFNL